MPRRKHFKGISRDVLDSFVSRYNDFDGFWALGQYVNFLQETGEKTLVFNLKDATTMPQKPEFFKAAQYYWQAILHVMRANKMPDHWLSDAKITFSIEKLNYGSCTLEITSDQDKTFKHQQSVFVRPHNPHEEQRRSENFGPSNQKMCANSSGGTSSPSFRRFATAWLRWTVFQ